MYPRLRFDDEQLTAHTLGHILAWIILDITRQQGFLGIIQYRKSVHVAAFSSQVSGAKAVHLHESHVITRTSGSMHANHINFSTPHKCNRSRTALSEPEAHIINASFL